MFLESLGLRPSWPWALVAGLAECLDGAPIGSYFGLTESDTGKKEINPILAEHRVVRR